MQNEFEKQVQKKMEELNLAPSAPVWQNIQEQIRRKKERKRLLVWLPLLFLAIGAGIWAYYLGDDNGANSRIEVKPERTVEEIRTEHAY